MGAFFGLVGFFGMLTCLIMLLVNKTKKKPTKNYGLLICVFFILFIVGYLIDTKGKKDSDDANITETSTMANNTDVTESTTLVTTNEPVITTTESELTTTTDEINDTTEVSVEEKVSFVLIDDVGEYGTEVVLNEGTEFEEKEIEYHIPEGSYYVTNNNTSTVQITICSGGPEYDGEWQSFVIDDNCDDPVVLMSGETKDIVIKEGQFVILSDDKNNSVLFEMK